MASVIRLSSHLNIRGWVFLISCRSHFDNAVLGCPYGSDSRALYCADKKKQGFPSQALWYRPLSRPIDPNPPSVA